METKRKPGRPKGSRNKLKLPLPEPTPKSPLIDPNNLGKASEALAELLSVCAFIRIFDGAEAANDRHPDIDVSWGNYRTQAPSHYLLSGLRQHAYALVETLRALGIDAKADGI